jgi:hypothetical protein
MTSQNKRRLWTGVAFAAVTVALGGAYAQQPPRGKSSYAPVEITEPFSAILARLSAQKPAVEQQHTEYGGVRLQSEQGNSPHQEPEHDRAGAGS